MKVQAPFQPEGGAYGGYGPPSRPLDGSASSCVMNSASSAAPALLRLQSWLSPAFPTGSYSYSHGLEWAVEAEHVHDRESLVDWLEADLRYGSGRNEAIFFSEAWRCARGR